jgi:hypothetical protein
MSFTTRIYRVFIASPGDLGPERQAAVDAVHAWNDLHSETIGIAYFPVRWETHVLPEAGRRPQEAINQQLLDGSDLLIGLFWTRLGTNTGVAPSGTVEEIERFISFRRPAMIYFSRAQVDLDKLDLNQRGALKTFEGQLSDNALFSTFDSPSDLRSILATDLTRQAHALVRRDKADWDDTGKVFDSRHRPRREQFVSKMGRRYNKDGKSASEPAAGTWELTDALEIYRTNSEGVWEVEIRPEGRATPTLLKMPERFVRVTFEARTTGDARVVRCVSLDAENWNWFDQEAHTVDKPQWRSFSSTLRAPKDSDVLLRIQDEFSGENAGGIYFKKIVVTLA